MRTDLMPGLSMAKWNPREKTENQNAFMNGDAEDHGSYFCLRNGC